MKNPKEFDASALLDFRGVDLDEPNYFERAAQAVTQEQLAELLEGLERADDHFTDDNRAGALDALAAITRFLQSSPFNGAGRFSRPFEVLMAELKNRPNTQRNRILPSDGSGASGMDGRLTDHHVQAIAALAVELLHTQCGRTVDAASEEIAAALEQRGFPFGERRELKWEAVKDWRRDFPRRSTSYAARAYRYYASLGPALVCEDGKPDAAAIHNWFAALVGRAGYGPTI